MARHYGSFLVRCWQVGDDERRIEVEHAQSGARTCVTTLADALDWMEGRCAAAAAQRAPTERAEVPNRREGG